jgi:glycosyltransferase involved in cell wall biosynthesis
MQAARAVLWPCQEAQMGYPAWWELFKAGRVRNVYAETGTIKPVAKASPQAMRKSWGVTPDRRVALFIGRPHAHKGFDRFADWADLNKARGNARWTFVHCGSSVGANRDLSALKLAGYVTDNGAAYLAADLVLIPNRHSYFDLGALEAVSLGAKLALAPSGGHGYLVRTCPSIPAIPDGPAEASWQGLEQLAEEYATGEQRQQALLTAWQERFSLAPFYRNILGRPRGSPQCDEKAAS